MQSLVVLYSCASFGPLQVLPKRCGAIISTSLSPSRPSAPRRMRRPTAYKMSIHSIANHGTLAPVNSEYERAAVLGFFHSTGAIPVARGSLPAREPPRMLTVRDAIVNARNLLDHPLPSAPHERRSRSVDPREFSARTPISRPHGPFPSPWPPMLAPSAPPPQRVRGATPAPPSHAPLSLS